MTGRDKKQALGLGLRICAALLVVVCVLGLAAYHLLSRNFHEKLADYSVDLMQAMAEQGVTTVEYELQSGRTEAVSMAASFEAPEAGDSAVDFPERDTTASKVLRMVYVTEDGTVASDGRQRDIRGRQDVAEAFDGEVAVFGPYFNEDDEFVVCYTAPVKRGDEIVGVLSLEKDGYRFSDIIRDIKFGDSGESYIINTEGTDIAVSDQEHIDWVNSQYNAWKILDVQEDSDARSVMELEKYGLRGESGVGTFDWEGSLCYVIYAPIPSVGWVMLTGVREEEIAAMTRQTLFSTVLKSSIPVILAVVLVLAAGLIIYWMITSMKKNEEINKNLEDMANHDALTGLLNRRFLETSLSERWMYPLKVSCQAAVFMMDIDNFKNYNDRFGHPQGDACLKRIATVFKTTFRDHEGDVLRYGGEEFVAVIFSIDRAAAVELGNQVCQMAVREGIPDGAGGCVTVSVGICYVDDTSRTPLGTCIENADRALYKAKNSGKNKAELFKDADPAK